MKRNDWCAALGVEPVQYKRGVSYSIDTDTLLPRRGCRSPSPGQRPGNASVGPNRLGPTGQPFAGGTAWAVGPYSRLLATCSPGRCPGLGEGQGLRPNQGKTLFFALLAALFFLSSAFAAESAEPQEKLSREERIFEALDEPTEMPDLKEVPLRDVVDYLKDHHKTEIQLDKKALDEVAISSDTPITKDIRGVSLKAALRLIFRDLGLVYLVRNDVLLITTPEEADAILVTKVYDVVDLVTPACDEADKKPAPQQPADWDMLIQSITQCVAPTTWDSVGGSGSIAPLEAAGIRTLVISQTQFVHDQIDLLLRNLRAARHGKPPAEFFQKPIAKPSDAERDASRGRYEKHAERRAALDAKFRKALDERLSVDFLDTPLTDVLKFFQEKTKLPFQFDKKAMNEAGVGSDNPVTFKSKDRQARHILDDVLKPLELTWIVRDEVVLVTTHEEAEAYLETRVYDIADLPAFRDENGKAVPDYDGMIATMTSTITATSWDDVGGPGSIKPFNSGGVQALVVSQTPRVHDQIVDLLASLRKTRKKALTKEELETLPSVPPPRKQSIIDWHAGSPQAPSDPPLPADPLTPKEDPLTEKTYWKKLAASTNQAGLGLFQELRKQEKGNLFFSPFSASSAMAMAYGRARGETANEIAQALGYTLTPKALHPAMKTLSDSYRWAGREPTTQLRVANRLWGRGDIRYRPEFLTLTRENYGAELATVNFNDPVKTANTINTWIEEQTARRIRNAISPQAIDKDMRLILTNAIYFKAKWATPFKIQATKPLPFFVGEDAKTTPTMYLAGDHRYGKFGDVQVLEKPYRGGGLAMVLLLPPNDAAALEKLETTLTAETLDEWLGKLEQREVWVYLPKFRFDTLMALGAPLQARGIRRAFDLIRAEFTGMTDLPGTYISAVMQKAFIDVAEEGTEAAAATAALMGGGFGGVKPSQPVIFRADHPFVFLIRDTRTGSILFLGRLRDPTQ